MDTMTLTLPGLHQQASPRFDSHPTPDGVTANSAKSKVEQQIVLRLPERLATEVRRRIGDQSLTNASISIHPTDDRNVIFRVEGMGDYPGTLVDLPCIIESLKTWDGAAYYKSADICQMLIVREIGDTDLPPIEFPSGLAPPTAHIRERRFRKPQFSKDDIQQAESHLWNILQGQPQVHYELIEEEVEIDEEAEEEQDDDFESGDEWEEEEDDSKWRASNMTGGTASIMRGTPMSEAQETPMSSTRFTPGHEMSSPGRFAVPSTGPHIRQSTPSIFPASIPSSVMQGPTPDPSPFGRPFSAPGFARQASSSSISDIPSLQVIPGPQVVPSLHARPFAQPTLISPASSASRATSMEAAAAAAAELRSPAPSEGILSTPAAHTPPPPEQAPMRIDEPDLDREKSALRQRLESEIVELQARVDDLTSKSQTTNKILKKRFTKNLEEAQQNLEQKKLELAAL